MCEHGVDAVCFCAPYEVSDIEDVRDVFNTNKVDTDELDELTIQGYHRRMEYVRCECGAEFNGRSAHKDFEEHLDES